MENPSLPDQNDLSLRSKCAQAPIRMKPDGPADRLDLIVLSVRAPIFGKQSEALR